MRTRLRSIHLIRADTSKMKRKKTRSKVDGRYVDEIKMESILSCDHWKLLRTILSLISTCEALESLYIISIDFPHELLITLGESIQACKSEYFRVFGMKNISLGDEGMKIIIPFLSQCNFKVVYLENCGLSDKCTDYVSRLIKAQEALMDTLFWNCTLRLDTRRGNCSPL